MNNQDIIRMLEDEWRDRLAAAVAAEREACAQVAEKYGYDNFCGRTTDPIATAIRARGNT